MEYRIAVLGSRDSILGFQALGLSAFPVQNPEEARTVSELSFTADSREGLAAVIEKRKPVFTGR